MLNLLLLDAKNSPKLSKSVQRMPLIVDDSSLKDAKDQSIINKLLENVPDKACSDRIEPNLNENKQSTNISTINKNDQVCEGTQSIDFSSKALDSSQDYRRNVVVS